MRLFPIALIVVGSLFLAKHLGLIPVGMFHVIGPVLLIALGVALLFRRPRRCGGRSRFDRDIGTAPVSPTSGGQA